MRIDKARLRLPSSGELLDSAENSFIVSLLRNGFSAAAPFLIIGSFALMLSSLPIDAWLEFLSSDKGKVLNSIFIAVYQYTLNILSLILIITLSISYRKIKDPSRSGIYTVVSVASYCAYVCNLDSKIDMDVFSPKWTLTAVLITILSCTVLKSLFLYVKKHLPYYTFTQSETFSVSAYAIIPICLTIALFAVTGRLICVLIGDQGMQNYLVLFMDKIFSHLNDTYLSALLFQFLVHFMWIFGIHGNNVLDGVARDSFESGMEINRRLIEAGQAPTEIFTKTFMDTFVLMGGCGVSLCLVLAILISAKKKQNKRLAVSSLLPSLFNISETVVFGLPVIFNPIMAIPFILVPLISLSISAFAVNLGIMPVTVNAVTWTTPVILSGYIATGSVYGSIVQLINLAVGTAVYIPFIKRLEKPNRYYTDEIKKLTLYVTEYEENFKTPHLLNNSRFKLRVAQNLSSDLSEALRKGSVTLYYQPQVTYEGKIIGAEGLLRWKHENYGFISPPLVIQLAKESEIFDGMSHQIIGWALRDLEKWTENGINNFKLSVNISSSQLESTDFCAKVLDNLKNYNIGNNTLSLEVTEREVLKLTDNIKNNIKLLSDKGVSVIMDDFGMGHSSVSTLQDVNFSYVKLDGSLVRDLDTNERSKSIVTAVCGLSKSLEFNAIGEYVENEDIRENLHRAGCDIYQGYLYSKALPFDEFSEYMKTHG